MINSSNRLLQRNQNMGGYKYSDHKRNSITKSTWKEGLRNYPESLFINHTSWRCFNNQLIKQLARGDFCSNLKNQRLLQVTWKSARHPSLFFSFEIPPLSCKYWSNKLIITKMTFRKYFYEKIIAHINQLYH